jgi:hypothetical protein
MNCILCGEYTTSERYDDCAICFQMKRKKMTKQKFIMLAKRIAMGQINPRKARGLPRPNKHSMCPPTDCRAEFPSYEIFSRQQNKVGGNISELTYTHIINSECEYCKIKPANGIDRRTNRIGYWCPTYYDMTIPMNVLPCCTLCNLVKGRFDDDFFIEHMFKIAQYNS